jgi:integrase
MRAGWRITTRICRLIWLAGGKPRVLGMNQFGKIAGNQIVGFGTRVCEVWASPARSSAANSGRYQTKTRIFHGPHSSHQQHPPLTHCFPLVGWDEVSGTDLTGYSVGVQAVTQEIDLDGVRLSPHTLRHSFALAYIENGGDPFSLQRILGHTNQETTSKYVNMARTNVKSQHSKYSPGERLG